MSASSQTTIKQGGTRQTPSHLSKTGRMKIWVFVVLGVLILGVIGAISYGMAFYENIYPNVQYNGISVGSLPNAKAAQVIENALDNEFAGKSISLTVGDYTDTLSAETFSVRLDSESAAQAAWQVGRSGSFFERLGVVTSCLFVTHESKAQSDIYIDREQLSSHVEEISSQLNKEVAQPDVTIHKDSLQITNGQTGVQVNTPKLADLIASRFQARQYDPILYQPDVVDFAPVDLGAIYDSIFIEPKNATIVADDTKKVDIVPEEAGVSFDVALARTLLNDLAEGASMSVPLIYTQPEIDRELLEKSLFADELGTLKTFLNPGNRPRTNNVRLAAEFMNETLLMPGDIFSYNDVVGIRSTARGFQEAGTYVQGKLVDELGGGICQVSSTLYGAVVRANLKIVERINHSLTVAYVPLGQDATVSWGSLDFKFENNTEYPIKVLAEQKADYLVVTLLGTKTDDTVTTMESITLSSTPFETVTTVNPALAPGTQKVVQEGHGGYTVETYRVIKDSTGKQISRTLESTSKYRKTNKQVEKGPDAPVTPSPSPDTDPTPSIPPDDATPSPSTPVESTPTPDPSPALPTEPTPNVSEPVSTGEEDIFA